MGVAPKLFERSPLRRSRSAFKEAAFPSPIAEHTVKAETFKGRMGIDRDVQQQEEREARRSLTENR